jgi:cyclopropane fatty-acyl-phospholipid synthase-like methyltransferase
MSFLRKQALKVRRRLYAARAWVPGLRERHRLEAMVGPLGFWYELQAYQLQALKSNGLQPKHHLLDLGCGPLQGGIAFIRYLDPARYVGVDINVDRLSAAYTQISTHGLADKNPALLLCDRFGESHLNGRQFDFVWASQVVYYFNEAKLRELFTLLAKRLTSDGKFLGDIIGPRHPEYANPGASAFLSKIELQTVEGLDRLASEYGLRARSLGEIEGFGYPSRLQLRTNVLVEVGRAEREEQSGKR